MATFVWAPSSVAGVETTGPTATSDGGGTRGLWTACVVGSAWEFVGAMECDGVGVSVGGGGGSGGEGR